MMPSPIQVRFSDLANKESIRLNLNFMRTNIFFSIAMCHAIFRIHLPISDEIPS